VSRREFIQMLLKKKYSEFFPEIWIWIRSIFDREIAWTRTISCSQKACSIDCNS